MRPWQDKMHEIIFEAETPSGKAFDVALLWAILLSVLAVMLESVNSIRMDYEQSLLIVEWFFTIIFTIEYFSRIACVEKPMSYIFSFLGLVDLLAVLPTYLSLFLVDTHYLIVIRSIRLLRVFRIFKLSRHVVEAKTLALALKASRQKITVFFGAVVSLVIIVGTLIYMIEGERNGFDNIPISIYWAVVTLTTVGYGDIIPHTIPGRALASLVMITGYAIIAIPTGIVTVELANIKRGEISTTCCTKCSKDGHDPDSQFCKYCGCILT